MKKNIFQINHTLEPTFYKDFKCLMGNCKHSCCCANWDITISKEEYEMLENLQMPNIVKDKDFSELFEKMPNGQGDRYAKFVLNDEHKCKMLNEKGLCSLQLECGEKALPKVCRKYPRGTIVTPNAREKTLSLSCEAVLELLWKLPNGIDFVIKEMPYSEYLQFQDEAYMYNSFSQIRSLCIDFLQCRAVHISKRLLLLGIALNELKQNWKLNYVETWHNKWSNILQKPSSLYEITSTLSGNDDLFLINNVKLLLQVVFSNDKHELKEISENAFSNLNIGYIIKGNNQEINSPNTGNIGVNKVIWKDAIDIFNQNYGNIDYFFENLMVTVAYDLAFPRLNNIDMMWKSYVELCSIYSLYRFITIGGCFKNSTKEHLFHVLVLLNRTIMHNNNRRESIREQLIKNNSDSLAHMAILVCS